MTTGVPNWRCADYALPGVAGCRLWGLRYASPDTPHGGWASAPPPPGFKRRAEHRSLRFFTDFITLLIPIL